MHRALEELIASNIAEKLLKVGAVAPAFSLPDEHGKTVSSVELLAVGPIVVTFFRGGWCPYCNLDLQAIEEVRPVIEKTGARLVAISPQTAANSRRATIQSKLGFPILTDKGNEVAAQFGLRFTMPSDLIDLYKHFGVDLPTINGEPSWTLPIPARFIIRGNNQISYAEANPDYTHRPEPAELLPALKSMSLAAE